MKILSFFENAYAPNCAVIPHENASGGEGAGATIGNQPLDTTIVDEVSPELLQADIEREVLKMKPSSTPIDQIMRHATAKKTDSMEVGYYAVDVRPERATLATAYTQPGSPTSNDVRVTLTCSNNDLFDLTDTILFPGVPGAADDFTGTPGSLVVRVVAKTDDGKLIVMALNGTSANGVSGLCPSIPQGSKMVRMGRAAGELEVQSPMLETLPTKKTNYCQIFKMQVEQSSLLAIHKKEADWSWSDLEENAIYEFRRGVEKSFLFGQKSKIYDAVKKQYIYTTGGIWHQTSKEFQYTAGSFTTENFVDLAKQAFVGNNGSNKRVLIGGSDFIATISKIHLDKHLTSTDQEVVWGITWNKIVTNFGTIYCLHDEVFDQVGMPGNGLILDPEFLSKRTLVPFGKMDLDLKKAGVRNTDARVITEISCAVLKYPDAHMKIIAN